jgi:AcrR family transcriptional regulator
VLSQIRMEKKMARKKKVDQQELMQVTEELLLKIGYERLNFKLIATQLFVGRSTIYEYYSNKEELVSEYMLKLMNQVLERVDQIEEGESVDPLTNLRKVLLVLLDYKHVHLITEITPVLDRTSPIVDQKLVKLAELEQKLFTFIHTQFQMAEQLGVLRQDLQVQIKTNFLYQLIKLKKEEKIEREEWAEVLFSLLINGLKK